MAEPTTVGIGIPVVAAIAAAVWYFTRSRQAANKELRAQGNSESF